MIFIFLQNGNSYTQSVVQLFVEDFNQDGFPDVVVGNLGLNHRMKPTKEFPIKMNLADFDKNGSVEQIVSYPLDGKYFTVATKDELVKQIPSLKKDFVRYDDFAGKTVDEIKSALERDNFMTAEVAKDFGLIDAVVEKRS